MSRSLAHEAARRPALPKAAEDAAAAYVAAVMKEAGMPCPHCSRLDKSEVVRTRPVPGGIRRERRCACCRKRFFTTERHGA